jgi:arginine utilization regulatory protein
VGALSEKPIDVKFISTCNIPPSQALETKKIRMDLFYRLAVVVIEIPPLRQRTSDIPLLCRYFLDRWAADTRQPPVDISEAASEMLSRYPWPGNVRELEHTLKSSLSILQGERTIRHHHLSSYFMHNYQRLINGESAPSPGERPSPAVYTRMPGGIHPDDLPTLDTGDKICLSTTLQRIEAVYLERALIKAGYNISKAGRFLNLSPQSMRYKIKKLGLHIPTE